MALAVDLVAAFGAGLETFLAGAFATGFFAGLLAAGFETFFAGALAAGLGLVLTAEALFLTALAFGFGAGALALAAGFLAAGFLGDDLDEGMGDGRWKRGMWIYRSHSLGSTEFPQAGGTKLERLRGVKVILKNKFQPLQRSAKSASADQVSLVIFGFEFPRV